MSDMTKRQPIPTFVADDPAPKRCPHSHTRDGGRMYVDPTSCCLQCGATRKLRETRWSNVKALIETLTPDEYCFVMFALTREAQGPLPDKVRSRELHMRKDKLIRVSESARAKLGCAIDESTHDAAKAWGF